MRILLSGETGENVLRNVLILGGGISGLGAAKVLLERECSVSISDKNDIKDSGEKQRLLRAGAEFLIGSQTPALLEGKDTVIVSPVVPRENPVVAEALRRGIPVLSEIELAWRIAEAPILAVTGTNGKTTTTTLLGNMIRNAGIPCATAGNIGMSLSSEAEMVPGNGLIAAELSSFQLEFIDQFRPKAAVILNITPDHLERHHTMEAYAAAKARIFENMGPEESLLLNKEDPWTAEFVKKARAHVYYLSTEEELREGAYLSDGWLMLRLDGEELRLVRENELAVQGHHNMEDCLAAAFLAYQGGVPAEAIRKALREYRPLEHRLEFVRTLHGVSYYNDSKATNTDAAVKAIGAFSSPVILIAGGHDKETPLEDFMAFVREHVSCLILIGAAAKRFYEAARRAGVRRIIMADSMKDAVEKAAAEAKEGDSVLLSPACSSYDMYRAYTERGRDFKNIVHALQ